MLYFLSTLLLLASVGTSAVAEEQASGTNITEQLPPDEKIEKIKKSIKELCHEPTEIGKSIKEELAPNGKLTLSLLEIGIKGSISKEDWEGTKNTIENNKDYRDCVKKLTPLFLENSKSKEILPKNEVYPHQESDNLLMELSKCRKSDNEVTCELFLTSRDSDYNFKFCSSGATLYNQIGESYRSTSTRIANLTKTYGSSIAPGNPYFECASINLIQDVKTPYILNFSNTSSQTESISKLTTNGTGQNRNHQFNFRNIIFTP